MFLNPWFCRIFYIWFLFHLFINCLGAPVVEDPQEPTPAANQRGGPKVQVQNMDYIFISNKFSAKAAYSTCFSKEYMTFEILNRFTPYCKFIVLTKYLKIH